MKGVIKGVLAEELANSLRMKKEYESALRKLPFGCLSLKRIKGHSYYYLVRRFGSVIRYKYLGRISKDRQKHYAQAKLLRAKYRRLLAQVKKQIRFLRSALRGKEAI